MRVPRPELVQSPKTGGGRDSPAPKLLTPGQRGPTGPGQPLRKKGKLGSPGELGRLPLKTPDNQNIDPIIEVSHEDSRVTLGPIF